MYQTPQQQTNDIIGFGMFIMFMGLTFGMVRSVVNDEPKPERKLLPMTEPRKPAVTVTCPICHKVIKILEYNNNTRTDALKRHIDRSHKSTIGLYPQATLIEGGEKVPSQYRGLIEWIGEPLPAYSLAVDLFPAVEPEVKERKLDEVLRKLKEGVDSIQDSDNFREFLLTMSKFHDYSIGNLILIMLQKPDATRVAGYTTWKELDKYVRKGEKGIAILAPCMPPKKTKVVEPEDENDESLVEVTPIYFKVVHVFDISQTDGEPLPEFEVPSLTGEANEKLFDMVTALARSQGLDASFESRPYQDPAIKGTYSGKNIWVRPEESRAQQLKTFLHEVAHYYSEGVFRIPRKDAETIAESAAFTVGVHFGFDSGVRSFSYVALWAEDKKVLEANLTAIRKVSTKIIDALEQVSKK